MSSREFRRISVIANPPRLWLASGFVLGVLAIGASIGLMATSGYLISSAALQPPIMTLTIAIVGVRFFGISRGILRYLERLISHDATLRALVRLRVAVFARLEPLVPTDVAGLRTGDLLQRFVADVDAQQNLVLRIVGPIVVAVGAGGLAVGIAVLVLPQAGLALAIGLLLAGACAPVLAARSVGRSAAREAPERAELSEELLDAMAGAAELAAYGRAADAVTRIDRASDRLARTRRRLALVAASAEGLMTTLTLLTATAVIAVATPAVVNGRLDGVDLAVLVLLALASFEAVRPLPAAVEQLGACRSSASRILDVIDREPTIVDPPVAHAAVVGDRFRLAGVRFRYGPDQPWTLDVAELELAAGQIVALTGPSGAGKSTITQLLLRFRDPQAGSVRIDDVDIRELRQEDVRSLIALAGQDAHLFPTSIRENLRIGAPEADDAQLMQALRQARADTWVASLPAGLDTTLAEDGGNVSGGQRQRLALTRALLARPRLLILDEPTAHLDAATAEPLLRDLLDAARESGVGVLLITHDQIDPRLVDVTYDLRHGRIERR